MLTHKKLDTFVKYKGNWDNWLRDNMPAQHFMAEEDWVLISICLQDLYLIQNGLVEEAYAQIMEAGISARCENATVVERLKELVPYEYGLWKTQQEKSLLQRCIDWVLSLSA